MRAFADPLAPLLIETGIDRLQVTVKGTCHCIGQGVGASDYRETFADFDTEMDWLATPEVTSRQVKLRTRKAAGATVSFSVLTKDLASDRVALSFVFRCNPTETLAHLLWRYRDSVDVASAIDALGEIDFFSAEADVPLSLDHASNWIFDHDLANRAFGPDIFTGFLPLYVRQLRALALRLASSASAALSAAEDGGEDVYRSDLYEIRLDWKNASAPQCETYFERYHASAASVVRTAAQNVLTKLDDATVRHHLNETGFARRGDTFSMRCRLANDRELSIYAKVPDRIRFEIIRKKAGRYTAPVQPGSSGRLLSILATERANLLAACQWRMVGELLTEHGVPVVTDLVALVTAVASAAADANTSFPDAIRRLLVDGGISFTESNAALVEALRRSGVLERTTLRRRDQPLPRRYALTPRYLAAFEVVLDAFSGSDALPELL